MMKRNQKILKTDRISEKDFVDIIWYKLSTDEDSNEKKSSSTLAFDKSKKFHFAEMKNIFESGEWNLLGDKKTLILEGNKTKKIIEVSVLRDYEGFLILTTEDFQDSEKTFEEVYFNSNIFKSKKIALSSWNEINAIKEGKTPHLVQENNIENNPKRSPKRNRNIALGTLLLVSIVVASYFLYPKGESLPTPKPETFLRLEIPENEYQAFDANCDFSYDVNKLYREDTTQAKFGEGAYCFQSIDLEPFNATMHVWHYQLNDDEALAFYINNSLDLMEERHQVVATGMKDEQFLRPESRVFGTLFELQGNVATPFQFYLTDSTDNFVRGEVLVNFRPNYDSMVPSLNYIKRDMQELMKTFEWKKQ